MKQSIKKLTLAIALSSALLLSAQQASATSYDEFPLSFDNSGSAAGSLTYDVAGGPLEGAGIVFDTVSQGGQNLTIDNGNLTFTTGDGSFNGTDSWAFGAGATGSFVLSGSFETASGTYTGNILTGNLISSTVTNDNGSYGFSGFGLTEIAPELLTEFGQDPNLVEFNTFANTYMELEGLSVNPDGTFSAGAGGNSDLVTTSYSLKISNSPVSSSGTTISMLGIGLFCLGFARRRFFL